MSSSSSDNLNVRSKHFLVEAIHQIRKQNI